jgi:NAD(P)H dehydrogenase (quinone)
MTNTLVIYSHPLDKGHNATILGDVLTELKERKEKYELINLYKEKFNPVLSTEEMNTRGKAISKEIRKYQDKIAKADRLIFIYPIWWNAPPAILKGFIDRVFSAGFAFKYVQTPMGTRPKGLLQEKKAIVFTTSGGPAFYFKYFVKARGSKTIAKDTLQFCGMKSKGFHYGNARSVTPESEGKLRLLVKRGLNWLY